MSNKSVKKWTISFACPARGQRFKIVFTTLAVLIWIYLGKLKFHMAHEMHPLFCHLITLFKDSYNGTKDLFGTELRRPENLAKHQVI